MVKKFLQKRSKRVTTRKLKKIEKKVREHNRKQRKEAKKNPTSGKKKKDIGIPNKYPFKQQLLEEAVVAKQKAEAEREKMKQRAKQRKARAKLVDKKRNLSSIVEGADKRLAEFEKKQQAAEGGGEKEYSSGRAADNSRKQYYKEFKKVVEASDVVLEVLDARDPLGSRCPQVEQAVLAATGNKKLVLLLNKIDLIPRENAEAWLKYLRNELPTVIFKASTQNQKNNIGRSKVSVKIASAEVTRSSTCVGADALLHLLANYSRNSDIKTAITVGVVGFPNTGKSSVINSLKRSRACTVGAMPGVTRAMQEVHLDQHVKILDSPGIVMASGTSDAAIILRNCVKVETVEDPATPVEAILRRCNKSQMMLHYGVPDYTDSTHFLALLASRHGRLKKGGVPDVKQAARSVLQDWNTGRISYYTEPPERYERSSHIRAEVVQDFAQAFDLATMAKADAEALKGLSSGEEGHVAVESCGPTSGATEDDLEDMEDAQADDGSEEEEMESDEDAGQETDASGEAEALQAAVVLPPARPNTRGAAAAGKQAVETGTAEDKASRAELQLRGNQQHNKLLKAQYKKQLKKRRRADNVAGQLSSALESAMESFGASDNKDNDDYDFSSDFVST